MSEADMTVNGWKRAQFKANRGVPGLGQYREGYHANFIDKIQPALPYLEKHNTKVVCNAGGSNPHGLAEALKDCIKQQGLNLRVAWVEGDDVTDQVIKLIESKESKLTNITTGRDIDTWKFEPLCAQCYLGVSGIARALEDADIVCNSSVSQFLMRYRPRTDPWK